MVGKNKIKKEKEPKIVIEEPEPPTEVVTTNKPITLTILTKTSSRNRL